MLSRDQLRRMVEQNDTRRGRAFDLVILILAGLALFWGAEWKHLQGAPGAAAGAGAVAITTGRAPGLPIWAVARCRLMSAAFFSVPLLLWRLRSSIGSIRRCRTR